MVFAVTFEHPEFSWLDKKTASLFWSIHATSLQAVKLQFKLLGFVIKTKLKSIALLSSSSKGIQSKTGVATVKLATDD